MWSKTKQVLESRLPDGLKGRVSYRWNVYRRDGNCPTECHVMSIFVDGECWFHTNQRFWDVKYGSNPEPKDNDIIRETGLVENYWGDTVSEYIHQFLNVLSIEEALAPGAPQLYPEMPGNIAPAKPFADMHMAFNEIHVGNVEEGFAEADVVVENDSLLDNAQNPLPPEAPGIICEWEGQYLTVRGSMSSSGLCKMMNAPFMQIPISNMRVIPAYVGGSYGSKHFSSQGSIILYASALAKVTNRPVGLFYDREEHFTAQTSRMVSKGHYINVSKCG